MTDVSPMVVADPLAPFTEEGMIKLVAPAKVNLVLGIGDKRSDGFHEVITVMHALSLHDVLHLDYEPTSEGGLVVKVRCYAREGLEPFEIEESDNLVFKAVHMLAQKLGRSTDETIRIRIEKHIPMQAGLGGGSSDAAAALIGAARIWGIEKDAPEVLEAASALGSDIAFFLYGGCAYFEGKGEDFQHELDPMKKSIVLVKPAEGVSTSESYRLFDSDPIAVPVDISEKTKAAREAVDVPLYNNLMPGSQKIVPELANLYSWIEEQPENQGYLLCGSGSATFVVCDSFNDACTLSSKAQAQGWWARVTTFSSLSAAIMPAT